MVGKANDIHLMTETWGGFMCGLYKMLRSYGWDKTDDALSHSSRVSKQ